MAQVDPTLAANAGSILAHRRWGTPIGSFTTNRTYDSIKVIKDVFDGAQVNDRDARAARRAAGNPQRVPRIRIPRAQLAANAPDPPNAPEPPAAQPRGRARIPRGIYNAQPEESKNRSSRNPKSDTIGKRKKISKPTPTSDRILRKRN